MRLDVDDFGHRIVFMKLPRGVKGTCVENDDGSNTIVINEQLSDTDQLKVYRHELKHILRGHFGRDINLSDAELDASESD